MSARRWVVLVAAMLLACSEPTTRDGDASMPEDGGVGPRDASGDGGSATDATTELDAGPVVAARDCVYRAGDYDAALRELDVGPTSTERLRFEVLGVPDPGLVDAAFLVFESWDADHPGEEGTIVVNAAVPIALPAMTAWDNTAGGGRIDVLSAIVAGRNTIEFGPGPLARSLFRIGRVALELRARVETCVPPRTPPPAGAVRRALHFHEATYTMRASWVVPCPPGHPRFAAIRDYAFTASGAEHVSTDCDGLYVAGSGERGTATFTFPGVVAATYAIEIRYRTSANRNPRGALFVVGAEEMRIDQVDASGEFEDVIWGERSLSGDVTVILDQTREAESSSVTEVRLIPVAGP